MMWSISAMGSRSTCAAPSDARHSRLCSPISAARTRTCSERVPMSPNKPLPFSERRSPTEGLFPPWTRRRSPRQESGRQPDGDDLRGRYLGTVGRARADRAGILGAGRGADQEPGRGGTPSRSAAWRPISSARQRESGSAPSARGRAEDRRRASGLPGQRGENPAASNGPDAARSTTVSDALEDSVQSTGRGPRRRSPCHRHGPARRSGEARTARSSWLRSKPSRTPSGSIRAPACTTSEGGRTSGTTCAMSGCAVRAARRDSRAHEPGRHGAEQPHPEQEVGASRARSPAPRSTRRARIPTRT